MNIKPLGDKTTLMTFFASYCPQIDVDQTGNQQTRGQQNHGARGRQNDLRRLPKKLFVGGLPFLKDEEEHIIFRLEMEMNENTTVWWDHVLAQDEGCLEHQGSRTGLRLDQVDVIVGRGIECDTINVEENELSTNGEVQVRIVLLRVLVGRVEVLLGVSGEEIRQAVTLHPETVELYVTNGAALEKRWSRTGV